MIAPMPDSMGGERQRPPERMAQPSLAFALLHSYFSEQARRT